MNCGFRPVSVWQALTLMQKGKIRVENPFAMVDELVEQMREAPLTHEIVSIALGCFASCARRDRFLGGHGQVLSLNPGDSRSKTAWPG